MMDAHIHKEGGTPETIRRFFCPSRIATLNFLTSSFPHCGSCHHFIILRTRHHPSNARSELFRWQSWSRAYRVFNDLIWQKLMVAYANSVHSVRRYRERKRPGVKGADGGRFEPGPNLSEVKSSNAEAFVTPSVPQRTVEARTYFESQKLLVWVPLLSLRL